MTGTDPFGTDPFGTGGIRERVLAAWAASPARFREDANAEEELALGAYRDRVVVELAQNAADAAARAGDAGGGRLLLRLVEADGCSPQLIAANTGAPLDEAGVQALATLRASAKRDGEGVGRFGVGFAAVLGVADDPQVIGRAGGVRFSRSATVALVRQAAARSPGLAEELERRRGHVPVLRLPLAARPEEAVPGGVPPAGYDTAVVLPLRDGDAAAAVRAQLEAVDDALLLALPALAEVRVELPGARPRELRDLGARWRVVRRTGALDAALLRRRPTEDRARSRWTVTWALPRDPSARPPAVVHAPTPSDEPLSWPALLVATFPLDSSRRRVVPGQDTDALVAEAAAAYADLLAELAAEPTTGRPGGGTDPRVAEPWRLVPTGLPAGALDGALRAALIDRLPGVPMLRSAEDSGVAVRPRDAVALEPPAGSDPDAVAVLAGRVAGLVLAPRAAGAAFELLGVRRLALADVVQQLPVPSDDDGWRWLLAGLAGLVDDAAAREALAQLPVPLADGRVVRGVRGLILSVGEPGVTAALARLGARVVRAELAAHDTVRVVLLRLGAAVVGPAQALLVPAVAAVVEMLAAGAADDMDRDREGRQAELVDAVLTLVAAAVREGGPAPGDLPWLADLPLPDAAGGLASAGALMLPGSPASRLLDPEAVGLVDAALVERWGSAVLRVAGVLDDLALVRAADVPLDGPIDPLLEHALDGVDTWLERTAGVAERSFGSALGAVAVEVVAVMDLDAVRDDAWPAALALVARDPDLRRALLTPVTLLSPGGAAATAPSYTAWWLRDRLAGGRAWADPDVSGTSQGAAPGLARLLPPAPPQLAGADPAVRVALGGVREPGQLDDGAVDDVLDRLADPDLDLDVQTVLGVWAALADLLAGRVPDLADTPAHAQVRVLDPARPGATAVVDAGLACVTGDPMHLQRADLGPFVVAPDPRAAAALAELLDLPLADDLTAGVVAEGSTAGGIADGGPAGRPAVVPGEVRAVLPAAATRWCEHDVLLVDGVEVDWWVDSDGLVHACTVDGLARGLAFEAHAWSRRGILADVLTHPADLPAVLLDEAFSRDGA